MTAARGRPPEEPYSLPKVSYQASGCYTSEVWTCLNQINVWGAQRWVTLGVVAALLLITSSAAHRAGG